MVDENYLMQGLMRRGLPQHIAQGFVMNMRDESGLNPGINEIAPIVPGSRGGFGLYQVTGPRRRAYEAFAQERGADLADPDAQLDFLMTELQGPERRAAESIFSAQNPQEAAVAIARDFLRPAPENLQKRVARYTGGNMQPQGLLGTPIVSTQGQAQQPQEELPFFRRPGVGNFFDTLAMGLEGMTLNPNRALIQGAQQRIQGRREQAQKAQLTNRTLDYLRQMGTPQSADALRYIEATGDVAGGLKLAREKVEPGYQVFTGAQLNEQYGTTLDPTGLFNVSGKGQITKVGGSDINLNMPGADKMADTIAKAVPDILTAGSQAKRGMLELQELSRLLETAPQGLQGGFVKIAGDFGLSFEGTDEVQAATAIINRLVPQQRQPGSGPMSDADLELFKQSLPRIINQPGGNQLIMNTIRRIMEYDIQRADIVEQGLRTGKGPQEIMIEVYALENPIPADFRQMVDSPKAGDEMDPDAAADLLLGR